MSSATEKIEALLDVQGHCITHRMLFVASQFLSTSQFKHQQRQGVICAVLIEAFMECNLKNGELCQLFGCWCFDAGQALIQFHISDCLLISSSTWEHPSSDDALETQFSKIIWHYLVVIEFRSSECCCACELLNCHTVRFVYLLTSSWSCLTPLVFKLSQLVEKSSSWVHCTVSQCTTVFSVEQCYSTVHWKIRSEVTKILPDIRTSSLTCLAIFSAHNIWA